MYRERQLNDWVRRELALHMARLPRHPAPTPVYRANALIDAARAATGQGGPLHRARAALTHR